MLILQIKANRNNFFIIISNSLGKVLFSKNSGSLGFKNSGKNTSEALIGLLDKSTKFILSLKKCGIFLKFDAVGEEMFNEIYKQTIKILKKNQFKIIGFKVINRIPHNGCRVKK